MYHPKVVAATIGAQESALGLSLREFTIPEVEEMAYRLRDVDWSLGTEAILPSLAEDLQMYILNEKILCPINWRYWSERYCKVVDDYGRLVSVKLFPAQERILSSLMEQELAAWERMQEDPNSSQLSAKMRLILVKARQVGGTVAGEDLVAHMTLLYKNTRSIVASDDIRTNSVKLYRVFSTIYDNLPPWMKPVVESRVKATNMHFEGLNSDLVVGGGNQKNTLGQGMTIDAVHLTEMSTWVPDVAEAVDEDLKPAFESSRKHHTLFLIESTGQGGKGNWFYDQYNAARSGKSSFKSLFLGWHSRPDKWTRFAPEVLLTPTTLALARRIEDEQGVALTRDQLVWYQTERADYESRGKLGVFLQEYPSSDEEAFQLGVRSVFPIEVRTSVRNGCKAPIAVFGVDYGGEKLVLENLQEWLDDASPEKAEDKVLLWELPRRGFTYVLAVDASYGLDGGDRSAIQVIRVGNRWEGDEQVAEWAGNVPPTQVDTVAHLLGFKFKDKLEDFPAMIAVEVNPGSPGIVCQTRLIERGYPNFYIMRRPNRVGGGYTGSIGWSTTPATRTPLVETGVDAIKKGHLTINSPWTVGEMNTFVAKMSPTGAKKMEHAEGYDDDRLMSLFIAYYVAHDGETSVVAEERARRLEEELRPKEVKVGRSYQTSSISREDMFAEWEERMQNLYD